MISLGLAQHHMGSLVQTREGVGARAGTGPAGPTPSPESPWRKVLWTVLTALAVVAATGAATWLGAGVVGAVRAEVALHGTVEVHETRLDGLDEWRSQEERARAEAGAHVDRLIELLEDEKKEREARARSARGRR